MSHNNSTGPNSQQRVVLPKGEEEAWGNRSNPG